ncbi:MAG: ABC transporter permease [Bacteroidota bacterium]
MSLSGFISKRITGEVTGFAAVIHRIAVISIGIGLGAMIISFLIMNGFRNRIRDKVYSFSGHLLVNRITGSNSMEEQPFNFRMGLYNHPDSFPAIAHVQEYSHKAGLIKSGKDIFGVMLKGVGQTFDQSRFSDNMKEGKFLSFPDSGYSNGIVVSRHIATKLSLKTGDNLIIHFFQNPPRARKLRITGIYETNLSDYFDEKIILCDNRLIQRLNGWTADEAGGLEIHLREPETARAFSQELMDHLPYDMFAEPVSSRFSQVFEWLQLISRQVNILLAIILAVVCVNMVSVILILVMERTTMIGMLKALGASDRMVRNIFFTQGVNLIVKGLISGNLLGLGLCWLQYQFRIIKLDPANYYMDHVPVSWEWATVIGLNLIVLVTVAVVMLIPVAVISRIRPVSAIRFD